MIQNPLTLLFLDMKYVDIIQTWAGSLQHFILWRISLPSSVALISCDTIFMKGIKIIAICYCLEELQFHISDLVSLLLCFIVCREYLLQILVAKG